MADSPRHVPVKTPMFDGDMSTIGKPTRTWIQFFEGLVDNPAPGQVPQITFLINDGSTGTNVAPVLRCPDNRPLTKCVLTVKASDASVNLTFKINRHNVTAGTASVFTASNTVAAGSTLYQKFVFTNLVAAQSNVVPDDMFTIDISSGSSSWQFTVSLE